jgi:tubulin beta
MREIIQIQAGQCGNQVGTRFWETLMEEHALDNEGSLIGNQDKRHENMGVYFNEIRGNKYSPR